MNKLKMLLIATFFLALLTGTVAATCQPAPPPDTGAPGAVTLVGSNWSGGNLRFVDKDGNVIFTLDGTNRVFRIDSGSTIDVRGTTSVTLTSANLAAILSNETGTNAVVFSNDPTLTRPIANELDVRGTASITWTSANLATFLSNETGTSTVVFSNQPSLSQPVLNSPDVRGTASITWTSADLATIVSNETGTNTLVFSNQPSLSQPVLNDPDIRGTASITWTSANLATILSDETGTSAFVLSNQPTLSLPVLSSPDIRGTVSITWNGSGILSRGRADIAIGNTFASVTHSLGTTPSEVILSWAEAQPLAVAASQPMLWSSVIDATTFTVNITGALSNRPSISWLAIK